MSQHRSAEEFLAPRRTLVANANSVLVDKLDEDLPRFIEADADQASSGTKPTRLCATKPANAASATLPELLSSSDAEVQRHALSTIDAIATPY